MKSVVEIGARVTSAGTLELLEPLPDEFRATDVKVIVVGASAKQFSAWEILGLQAFFADDDEADSIYDDLP